MRAVQGSGAGRRGVERGGQGRRQGRRVFSGAKGGVCSSCSVQMAAMRRYLLLLALAALGVNVHPGGAISVASSSAVPSSGDPSGCAAASPRAR